MLRHRVRGLMVYLRAGSHLDTDRSFIETTNVCHFRLQWCNRRDLNAVMTALKGLSWPSVNYKHWRNPFVPTSIEVWCPNQAEGTFERLSQMILEALAPIEEAARQTRRR